MAGNEQVFDQIVDPIANKQVQKLTDDLITLDGTVTDTIQAINQLNQLTASSSTFSGLSKNTANVALAQEKLNNLQQQGLILQAKKDAIVQASADKQAAAADKIAAAEQSRFDKQIAASIKQADQDQKVFAAKQAAIQKEQISEEKKAEKIAQLQAKQQKADQKTIANSQSRIAALNKEYTAYEQLNNAISLAEQKAREIGIQQGVSSTAYTKAAADVNKLRNEYDSINKPLNVFANNSDRYAQGIETYAKKAFSGLRTLANILPNFGIGTAFLLIGTGIEQLYEAIKGGESILSLNKTLTEETNKQYAQQSTEVRTLVAEIKDQNTVASRRQEIIEKLNEISPTYFGNLKTEDDVVENLQEDYAKYNTALQLSARIKAAQQLIGDKYVEQLKAELLLTRLNTEETKKSGVLGFLQEYVKTLQQLTNLGGLSQGKIKDILKGIEEGKIEGITKNIQQLTDIVVKAQQDLTANGGDIAGNAISEQERIANSLTEIEKLKLQAVVDANNAIVDNDKKSYAARESALNLSTQAQKKILARSVNEELSDTKLTNDKKLLILAKYNNDIAKLNEDSEKKQQDLIRASTRDQVQLQQQRLNNQKKTAEGKTLDPNGDYEERINALDTYNKASRRLIKTELNLELSDAGDNYIKAKTAREKATGELLDLDNDVAKKRIQINKDATNAIVKSFKDGIKVQEDGERESIEIIQKAGDDKILAQQQNAADAEAALADQYAKGLITQKEYQRQLTEINDQADIDRIDQEIVTTNAIIEVRKGLLYFGIGSAKELQSAEDKLAAEKLARVKAGTKAVLDGAQEEAQARQQLHDKEKELGDASLTLIQTVVDAGYARQIQALEKVSQQIDDNATKEKDANNNSLLSAKDKADKNAVIDARAAQQKAQITLQENRLKRQQAEFDRAIAIARIIEETAIGVVTALTIPIGGFALAAVISALGAVQIATVLATPLPSFKDGGFTPGGKVLWGEAGAEMATLPDGSKQLSTGPTIQSFPKGTKITPHLELMQMLKPEFIPTRDREEIGWRELKQAIDALNKPNKRPVTKINIDGSFERYRKSYFK